MRQRILVRAGELLARRGFGATTMDEVAASLGMSKKTLYQHFASKEDLAREARRDPCSGYYHAPVHPGDVVSGRFVIERLAGSGGMGSVYRATDRETGGPVALKVLQSRGERDVTRFGHEARVLSQLEHPGIVRYVAHGALGPDAPYLVMEWLAGEGLDQQLTRAGLSVAESVAAARAVAGALAVAHAAGVIHRDLKPSNLMLTGDAAAPVKIVDFGIARAGARSMSALTRTGMLMGTPGYMAPEQARGARDIDARVDVFALGAVLFECLTRRPAFLGEHVMALLAKLLLEEPPRVDDLRPDVPAALADLVARMLSKAREARPADGAAVAAELDKLGAIEGSTAPVDQRRPEALTGHEQRLLCFIIAAPGGLGEGDDPEAETLSSEALAETGTRLQREVLSSHGRVDMLAFGGFLVTLESAGSVADQAARAAQCALKMRSLLPALPIALVTGRAEASGRTPVGHLLDRAGKLIAARVTPGGGVRVDEVTRGLLDLRFEVAPAGEGWELRGEREISEETRTLLGRPTPCVGRDRELRTLLDLIEESAVEGVARAVLVTAQAGMGKSRVRQELLQRVRRARPEMDIWQGRGDALSAGSAFSLLGSALRHAAGILGGEPLRARQDKLRARVARHVDAKDQARVAAFVGEITGAPLAEEETPRLRAARQNAATMAEQIHLAWLDFASAEAAARPLLLVLEDAHWGDLPSIRLIDAALRELSDRPLLVVALARPEVYTVFPRLWHDRGLQEVRLGELSRRAAEALVRHALGSSVAPQQVTALVERAAGNAFYLEELIRLESEGHHAALPETVLGMVEARLLGLDPEARRTLRAASVFGGTFWERGVSALLGGVTRTTPMNDRLSMLVAREVIQRRPASRFPEEQEFVFRHALLCEGAYAMLSEGDRALGHKLAAAWLEKAGESDPMVLAEHFERGGEPARAVAFYRSAAEQSLRGRDIAVAIEQANRGVRCGAAGEERAHLLAITAEASIFSSDLRGALPIIDAAVASATPGGLIWCRAISCRLYLSFQLGQTQSMLEIMAALPGVEPDKEGASAFVSALGPLVQVLMGVGQFALAETYIQRIEQLGGPIEARDRAVRGWLEFARAIQLFYQWETWPALELFQRAAASFEEAGERQHVLTLARVYCSSCYIHLGAHARGREIAEAMVAQSQKDDQAESGGRFLLAIAHAGAGEIEEAARGLLEVITQATESGNLLVVGSLRFQLAQLELRFRDPAAAEREALLAIDLLAHRPGEVLATLSILADARLKQGRVADARAAVEQALAVQRTMPPAYRSSSNLCLVHAEVLDATGDRTRARELIAAARDALLTRAERIGDPAIRRSFLETIPENARIFARAKEWLDAPAIEHPPL